MKICLTFPKTTLKRQNIVNKFLQILHEHAKKYIESDTFFHYVSEMYGNGSICHCVTENTYISLYYITYIALIFALISYVFLLGICYKPFHILFLIWDLGLKYMLNSFTILLTQSNSLIGWFNYSKNDKN